MKKILLILVGVGLAIGILGAAGYVSAQTGETPEVEENDDLSLEERPFVWGDKSFGGHGFGLFGDGVLSEYMLPALVDVFSFSDDQAESFQVVKDTIQKIKEEFTPEEIRENMQAAFTNAIDEAVAEGAITKEQAEQMLERREMLGKRSFGSFNGRGMHGDFFGPREGGILRDYMDAALIEVLGLSESKLQSMKEEGFNLRKYAEEENLSNEELAELMAEIHTYIIKAALNDGVITQEQADKMLDVVGDYGLRVPFGLGLDFGMHGNKRGGNNSPNW